MYFTPSSVLRTIGPIDQFQDINVVLIFFLGSLGLSSSWYSTLGDSTSGDALRLFSSSLVVVVVALEEREEEEQAEEDRVELSCKEGIELTLKGVSISLSASLVP